MATTYVTNAWAVIATVSLVYTATLILFFL